MNYWVFLYRFWNRLFCNRVDFPKIGVISSISKKRKLSIIIILVFVFFHQNIKSEISAFYLSAINKRPFRKNDRFFKVICIFVNSF